MKSLWFNDFHLFSFLINLAANSIRGKIRGRKKKQTYWRQQHQQLEQLFFIDQSQIINWLMRFKNENNNWSI